MCVPTSAHGAMSGGFQWVSGCWSCVPSGSANSNNNGREEMVCSIWYWSVVYGCGCFVSIFLLLCASHWRKLQQCNFSHFGVALRSHHSSAALLLLTSPLTQRGKEFIGLRLAHPPALLWRANCRRNAQKRTRKKGGNLQRRKERRSGASSEPRSGKREK